MKTNFVRSSLLSFGFISAISLAVLSFGNQPARAQTSENFINVKDKLVQEFGVNPSLVRPITSYYRNLPIIVTQSTPVVR
ncbi:hypothetical protein F7734_02340 [Scytonema sp. UIC 10036]|uniref:hypothetical protein n=1 Tax=Scytonema sp. UIC 10036 TaxID=2304196 RepID=UPI0012DAEC79|nr:hypothetical protein [Scytonema sp. UIC 10036]MUG91389.1 hypothetical protein [Scytonema sp. UIC 10036]